jgi:adenosylcobyric acid synthase
MGSDPILRAPALMFQGTGSDVGKSLIVAGLCRAFARRGLAVRPFKPQNLSNNAAVAADGGEIGRAQALQARAALIAPSVHMNPVLLKPQSETGAQVVVQGCVEGQARARAYQSMKRGLLPRVLESFERLAQGADLLLVEGAGSASEVNLRDNDIANMGFAEAADLPVILIGDIDRGGVIASLVGTWALLGASEQARIKGFIVNKMRGDPSLFDGGLRVVAERTGLASLGLVPWFAEAARLPAEDSLALDAPAAPAAARPIKVVAPRLPAIANFDDLDPLRSEPDVAVEIVPPGRALPGDADLVMLPGSKATRADLARLREEGWDIDQRAHVRRGGWVAGLCGGFQMLGRRIDDPLGLEGAPGGSDGLGLLDVETTLAGEKTLVRSEGVEVASGETVQGYEIHLGRTTGAGLARPMLRLRGAPDGAVAGRVMGCYLHGLFAADGFRHAFLARLRERAPSGLVYEAEVDAILDRLAAHLEAAIDLDRLLESARAR